MDPWASIEPIHDSIPDRISTVVARMIETGQLRPGSKLPGERRLVDLFDASRISVRLALQDLAANGYLHAVPRSGWVVADPAEQDLALTVIGESDPDVLDFRYVIDLRNVLEPAIAARAAFRRTTADLGTLSAPLIASEQEIESAEPRSHFLQICDVQFHSGIARAAHNPLLARMLHEAHRAITTSRSVMFDDVELAQDAIAGHRRIYSAIERRDARGADRAMHEHLTRVVEALTSTGYLRSGRSTRKRPRT